MHNNKDAIIQAYKYLARRDHARKEIFDKLKKKNFSEETIKKAILYLEDKSHLNDLNYGKSLVSHCQRLRKMGYKAIYYELINKGLSKEDIENSLKNYSEEIEKDNIEYYFNKFKKTGKDKKQIIEYLKRKGYNLSKSAKFEF